MLPDLWEMRLLFKASLSVSCYSCQTEIAVTLKGQMCPKLPFKSLQCYFKCFLLAVLCFVKPRVNIAIYQEILGTLHFCLLTTFLQILLSFSSTTLHMLAVAKLWVTGFLFRLLLFLTGQPTNPDLNSTATLWSIVKMMKRDIRPNNTDELKAASLAP